MSKIPDDIYYVIPDTSFLLRGNCGGEMIMEIRLPQKLPPIWRIITLPLRLPLKLLKRSMNNFNQERFQIPATWVILDEVVEEIANLHRASDGPHGTAHAKDNINRIFSTQKHIRVSGSSFPLVPLLEPDLGIDSLTDHRIISAASSLSKNTPVTIVTVLTNDSGMKLEIDAQHRCHNLRMLHRPICFPYESEWREKEDRIAAYLLKKYRIGRVV